jgi:hypothetical protein
MTLNLGAFSLVTEDDVEAYLSTVVSTLSSADSNKMSFILNIASQMICSFTNRSFALASYTDVFDGVATDMLVPREWPIKSIVTLKFSADGDFSTSTDEKANSVISTDGTSVDLRDGLTTPRGRATVQLEYTAGYSSIPHDLRYAALVQYQYLTRNSGSTQGNAMLGLKSISKMGEGQTKDTNIEQHGLCGEALGIVEKYRRVEAPRTTMFQRIG